MLYVAGGKEGSWGGRVTVYYMCNSGPVLCCVQADQVLCVSAEIISTSINIGSIVFSVAKANKNVDFHDCQRFKQLAD